MNSPRASAPANASPSPARAPVNVEPSAPKANPTTAAEAATAPSTATAADTAAEAGADADAVGAGLALLGGLAGEVAGLVGERPGHGGQLRRHGLVVLAAEPARVRTHPGHAGDERRAAPRRSARAGRPRSGTCVRADRVVQHRRPVGPSSTPVSQPLDRAFSVTVGRGAGETGGLPAAGQPPTIRSIRGPSSAAAEAGIVPTAVTMLATCSLAGT